MTTDLEGRSLLQDTDLTKAEFVSLLDLADELRAERASGGEKPRLVGRSVALIFEKTSTRTRVSFQLAAEEQGAHALYLGPGETQLGEKESIADTARFLGRLFDGIEYRGGSQRNVEELGALAGVPVWNGLTDRWHPTQMLADVLTMRDHSDRPLEELALCYLGDARNNTANSLLVTAAQLGLDLRIAAPEALSPDAEVRSIAQRLAADSGRGSPSAPMSQRPSRERTSCTPTFGSRWASPPRRGTHESTCSSPTRSTPRCSRRRRTQA